MGWFNKEKNYRGLGVMTIIKRKLIQGTPEWKNARVGCITMSNAKALLTGGSGATRKNYLLDVASEMASGVLIDNIKSIPSTATIL